MKNPILVFFLAALLCFAFACQNKAEKAELEKFRTQAKLEEQNKEVVKSYWNGKWNERRPGILDELQTSNVVYHGTSMEMNGLEEYKKVYGIFSTAFQDTQITIEGIIAEGDTVMTRVKMTGMHKVDFEGIPATGKVVTLSAFTVFRLVDGKIAEEWEILDDLGLMMQLGMELKPKEAEKK
jgi:steroid delta-isomerase-like uncharacterized protein